MRVVLCCLAKNEELYINDFVKWYVKLGFDTIYLFDNNDKDKPLHINFIEPQYHKNVITIDIRGMAYKEMQADIYTKFYRDYGNTFNWCLFCDVDEFLTGITNIKCFLTLPYFMSYKQIRIKWKLFGDDDLITRDMSKPVYKVFKNQVLHSFNRNLIQRGNLESQAKCMVRGKLKNVKFGSVHYAKDLPSCLPNGRVCYSKVAIKEKYIRTNVYLNHYMTKSLSEFINQKLNRNDAVYNTNIKLNYYWRINKKTPEKVDFLKGLGLWHLK